MFVRAAEEHVAQMHEIELEVFPTPWSYESLEQDVCGHEIAYYIVGLVNGRVVSYAGFWFVLDEAHITNVAVKTEYRRKGIGRKMMELLLEKAQEMGIITVSLEVRVSNKAARDLYKSLGFSVAGLRKKYYANNDEDALLMSKIMEPMK
ncbi:MAG: ribosomal protein S18-alanine N-acetyltransferase [Clostridia bacterium]|nr:ribosomal protein S18-alanine N-acetyltransferase [Clostridia bacterium]MBN2882038.1 ribosomal protein S18-alanine N-acetyltransferase [Clostridia bacterium]